MDDKYRIKSQRAAAAMLEISTARLRELANAPWWNPDFRTAAGYHLGAILRAQYEWNSDGADDDLKKRKALAQVERLERQASIAELQEWELQRQKELAQGNILPADVHIEFVRELLGMIRSRIEELPEALADHFPDHLKPFAFVPEELQKSERDASPLQRLVRKIVNDVETWLTADPVEESAA